MNEYERINNMKQSLYEDLRVVIDNHKVDIGHGLLETDVVGVIEKVKFEYMLEMSEQ